MTFPEEVSQLFPGCVALNDLPWWSTDPNGLEEEENIP